MPFSTSSGSSVSASAIPGAGASPPTASRTLLGKVAFWAWAIVFAAVFLRVAFSPHQQSVYWRDYALAGQRWILEKDLYPVVGQFLYSPLAAAFFAPFSLFPDAVGGILWRALCGSAFLGASYAWLRSGLSDGDVEQLADRRADPRRTPAVFLWMLPLSVGNLNNGQANLLVFALAAGGILAARRKHWNLAACAIAAVTFLKIYPLAIGLLLVLLYPRQLLWRAPLALAGLFTLSLLLHRPSYVWTQYHQWFACLGADSRRGLSTVSIWRDFDYLLRVCGVSASAAAYMGMEAAAGAALAFYCWINQQWRRWPEARLLDAVLCLGCCWMTLFGPATEAATYVLLALPVSIRAADALFSIRAPGNGRRKALGAVFLGVYLLLLAADFGDSWVHGKAQHHFTRVMQPLAALIFAAAVAWPVSGRQRAEPEEINSGN